MDNIVWEVAQFDPHIFIARHGRVEVEILNVDGHEFCIWCLHYAVQEYFDCENVHCWCATVPWEVYSVSANAELDSVRVVFFISVNYNYPAVYDVSPSIYWHTAFVNK